eukprot:1160721-Pelagomonas_calceolata.AAC.9
MHAHACISHTPSSLAVMQCDTLQNERGTHIKVVYATVSFYSWASLHLMAGRTVGGAQESKHMHLYVGGAQKGMHLQLSGSVA